MRGFPTMDDDDSISDEEMDSPPAADEPDEQENEAIQQDCLDKFSRRDYIMEPGVFATLQRYFKSGGVPEKVVEMLSANYSAVAQTVNLLAEWLILADVDIRAVQEMVESHLKDMLIKHFDPKKADSIFMNEGETPSWLAEMIEYPTWRELFYKLAEEFPDCLMLNFTIKLISDAGHQGEITSVSTACHQMEVFSRVLRTSVSSFLGITEDFSEKNLKEFVKMACHGEHTYLYSHLVLQALAHESKGGARVRRLRQELERHAKERGLDVTPITMALSGAARYPQACQAVGGMLSKGALNPADVSVLFRMYSADDPPPVDLVRSPQLLDMLSEALFKPGAKINPEYKSKYAYMLAYSSAVYETFTKKNARKGVNKDELKVTLQALEKAQTLCGGESKVGSELIADLGALFACLKFPVVAMGVLRWVDYTVSDPLYFVHNTDHTPLHLAILDEIGTNQSLLHDRILELLKRLFEATYEELDVLVQLELKKTILDRMVHLLSRGSHVTAAVIQYVRGCWEKRSTDNSLIRYFVTEVLDIVAPPFTSEFTSLFLPLVENEEITGCLKLEDRSDPVNEFLSHCR